MIGYLLAGAAGAALVYFLDPDQGRRRRHITRDRAQATLRRGFDQVGRYGRFTAGKAYGISHDIGHLGREQTAEVLDDATLAQKVETEIFRDPAVPKGQINVNAENGVVVLRGELDHPERIKALEAEARRVPGVKGVENLLHLPGTPARMS
ncbi:MAG: BON domain-containing protein [Chloroflexota bacterium]